MAQTFQELKTRLEYYVDDTVSNPVAIMLFNQCSEDLSVVAGYAKTSSSTFDKDVPTISLPLDWLEMIELQIKRTSDKDYYRIEPLGLVQPSDFIDPKTQLADGITGYEWFGDTIEIRPDQKENGTLRLRYYAMLPSITALTESPVIKPAFHDAYALYGAAKYFQNYMDELKTKRDYHEEYMIKKLELKNETDKARARTKSKTVYQFRSWT